MADIPGSHIACPLQAAARRAPGSTALISPDRELSYRELDALVTSAAGRLRQRRFEGNRIGFLLETDWSNVVLVLAAIRAGAVACPLSTRLPPAGTAERLRQIHAAVLISDGELPDSDHEYSDRTIHPAELLPQNLEPSADTTRERVLHLDQPATIVFTSGSTGSARAALHTFGNHYYSAAGSNENIRLGRGDRWLLSLPLYHVGGLAILFRCVLGGAAVVIPDRHQPIHHQVRRATHVSLVATQLRRLLEAPQDHRLQALLLGGGPIPVRLLEEAHRRDLPIHTSYGLTEMASQVSATPPQAPLDVLRTAGHVLPHREVHIDRTGEILVRGSTRFEGYVEGATIRRPFDENGWFQTGDLGAIGDDGLLRVTGRKDNMFISGGENIQPEEIEAVLSSLETVAEAVVVPIEDEEYGHRPVAFVRFDGRPMSTAAMRDAVERVLPRFMAPVAFYAWPEEQAQEGIKVDRERLRRRAEGFREN